MIELGLNALRAVDEIYDGVSGSAFKTPGGSFKQVVLLANQVAARETAALLLLLDAGLDDVAVVHARGLFELRVSVEFIAGADVPYSQDLTGVSPGSAEFIELTDIVATLSEQYLMHGLYSMARRADRLKLPGVDDSVRALAAQADEKFGYSKRRHRWHDSDLRKMAERTEHAMRYDLVYALGSELIHHGGHQLIRHAGPTTPDWMDRELTMWSSLHDLIYLLLQFDNELSLNIADSVNQLNDEWRRIDALLGGSA